MFDAGLWFAGLAALAVFALAGWAVSVPLRNVSIVDSLWSLMFLVAAADLRPCSGTGSRLAPALLLALVSSGRCACRSTSPGATAATARTAATRRSAPATSRSSQFKSLYLVFGLQAVLAGSSRCRCSPPWPLQRAARPARYASGVALWVVGIVFEARRRLATGALQGRSRQPRPRDGPRASGATRATPTTSATSASGGASS